ncbi:DUF2231 domain-containing protein [Acidobacteriota bacterium]
MYGVVLTIQSDAAGVREAELLNYYLTGEIMAEEKKLTIDEVNYHDGREGKRAYVVYAGVIYDMTDSRLWKGGSHMMRHRAGQDLTEALAAAPHGASMLERCPRVGTLVSKKDAAPQGEGAVPAASPVASPTGLIKKILGFHPHPITIHFPIALSVATTVFVVLYLFTKYQPFEKTAFFLLAGACLMAPASIATGGLSWWFSYGHKLTAIFKAKIALSVVLEILALIGLILRVPRPEILAFPLEPLGWFYLLITLLLAPTVMILGYCGGRITFPR